MRFPLSFLPLLARHINCSGQTSIVSTNPSQRPPWRQSAHRHALLRLGLCVAALVACSGCATLFKGSTSKFNVAGLKATDTLKTTDGVEVAHEGEQVRLPSNDGTRALIVKTEAGEKPMGVRRFVGAGWVVLDILCGLVPLIIDATSGNWWEYDDVKLPTDTSSPREGQQQQAPEQTAACKAAADYDTRAANATSPAKEQLAKLAAIKHKECEAHP